MGVVVVPVVVGAARHAGVGGDGLAPKLHRLGAETTVSLDGETEPPVQPRGAAQDVHAMV